MAGTVTTLLPNLTGSASRSASFLKLCLCTLDFHGGCDLRTLGGFMALTNLLASSGVAPVSMASRSASACFALRHFMPWWLRSPYWETGIFGWRVSSAGGTSYGNVYDRNHTPPRVAFGMSLIGYVRWLNVSMVVAISAAYARGS